MLVKYQASGMKSVLIENIDRKEFWAIYRRKKKRILEDDPDGDYLYISCEFPKLSFEIVNERLADGCDQYIARPDDWPLTCGEPA